MPKYLTVEPDFGVSMEAIASHSVQPHVHTVYNGDFMGMCTHDIACQVCFDAPAVIERDVTPGKFRQTVQPCRRCQDKGWMTAKLPKWVIRWFAWRM